MKTWQLNGLSGTKWKQCHRNWNIPIEHKHNILSKKISSLHRIRFGKIKIKKIVFCVFFVYEKKNEYFLKEKYLVINNCLVNNKREKNI